VGSGRGDACARSSDPAQGRRASSRRRAAPRKVVHRIVGWGLGSVLGLVVITATGIGLSAGAQAYNRAEERANADNLVRLTRIQIRTAQQQALVARAQVAAAKADAEKQYQRAVGVRRAQNVIMRGLTPQYLQYEAIQAQKAVATSGRNNTLIYVPSGSSGVPLVQDPQSVNRLKP
jgi:hypothetical protein